MLPSSQIEALFGFLGPNRDILRALPLKEGTTKKSEYLSEDGAGAGHPASRFS
jgi:hypothetical protein